MRESGYVGDDSEMTYVAVGAKERISTHETEVGVSPGLGRGRMRSGWNRGVEEGSSESEAPGLHCIGEDSEVSDPDKSLGHDMT